jgi:hypothetical protein
MLLGMMRGMGMMFVALMSPMILITPIVHTTTDFLLIRRVKQDRTA